MRWGWIIGESERLTKARKASWATACAFLQDGWETSEAKVYIQDCLDTVFSDLLSRCFPLVSAGQCWTADRRRRWICEEHLSECEGEDFRGQFSSLEGSYRARTERAEMTMSREGSEGSSGHLWQVGHGRRQVDD